MDDLLNYEIEVIRAKTEMPPFRLEGNKSNTLHYPAKKSSILLCFF
jgi:hypothetical protein